MDINSLLSPSDSPAGTPTPQPHTQPALPSPSMLQSPSKRAIRQMPSRTPSGLSQHITSSPQPHTHLQQLPSPALAHITNGARAVHSAMGTPQPIGSPHDTRATPPHYIARQDSTAGMDTLAGRFNSVLVLGGAAAAPLFSEAAISQLAEDTSRLSIRTAGCDKNTTNILADLASMQQQQQAVRQNSVGHQRPVT